MDVSELFFGGCCGRVKWLFSLSYIHHNSSLLTKISAAVSSSYVIMALRDEGSKMTAVVPYFTLSLSISLYLTFCVLVVEKRIA